LITIIDLGISNIKSIYRGFFMQGFPTKLTTSPEDVKAASSLVLPGVGAFRKAVEILKKRNLWDAVVSHGRSEKPLIGICLGMQLLFSDSEEHGFTEGLDLLRGHVKRFPADRPVPHMGWNEVVNATGSVLFREIPERADFYFVHSFYAQPADDGDEIGYSDHYGRFTAAVQKGNVFGVQFHPEKSQKYGLLLLKNFALLTET
jgi:glutamine amidotransferase